MRLSVASLRRLVKRPLHVEFTHQELTSYSGLELLRRYLRQIDLAPRLRAACATTGGDYGGGRLALLVLALELPRFRGHQGYGALRWGAEEMSAPTSRVSTRRVMGSSKDEWGDTEIAAPLVRVAPGASMELGW